MLIRNLLACSLAASFAVLGLSDRAAHACGGCFRPTQTVSVVDAHRMVFSVSKEQTILWDQFTYSGNPSEFAWVLPVHAAGIQVDLAHDEFISAIDAYTSPVITGPAPQSSGGFGCSSANSFAAPGDNSNGGVQVINQQVVGPYEVVTLRSTDSGALETWLASHNYEISDSVKPTIAAYVGDGFDFLALRLLPGYGVGAMQPVRVVTQGADPTLPLRMVAAGVGSNVSILLYVISEGRYETANFNNTQVDFSKLEWNKNTASSNYDTLVQTAMTSGDGRNFVVEYAGPLGPNFQYTYYQGAISAQKCAYTSIHGTDFATINPFGDGGESEAGTDDSGADDGGVEAGQDDAGTTDAGTGDGGSPLGRPYDQCNFDDLTSATATMNPSDIVVTRLRANLNVSALSQDLVIRAAADQSPYSNLHNASATGDGCSTADSPPDSGVVIVGLGAMALLLIARKRHAA